MKNIGFRNILLGNVTKYTNVKQTHELKLNGVNSNVHANAY